MLIFTAEDDQVIFSYNNGDELLNIQGYVKLTTDSKIKQYFTLCLLTEEEQLIMSGILFHHHVIHLEGKYHEFDGDTRNVNINSLLAAHDTQELDLEKDALELFRDVVPDVKFINNASDKYNHIMQALKKQYAKNISNLIWSLQKKGLHASLVENIVQMYFDQIYKNF